MARPTPKPSTATLAEARVYSNAIDAFLFTAHETTPFPEDGYLAYPNLDIRGTAHTLNSSNTLGLGIDIDINGQVKSGGSKQILGRATGINATANVNGEFSRDFQGSLSGVSAGSVQGSATIDVDVQPFTELRVGRRLVLRALNRAGNRIAAQKAVKKKAEMNEQVNKSTDEIVQKANAALQKTVLDLSDVSPDTKKLPFTPALSSRASDSQARGHLSVALRENQPARDRSPQPAFEQNSQIAASFVVHEDAINESLTPLLAGKRIRLGEAFSLICGNRLLRKLAFCQEKMDEKAANTWVQFDNDRPIHISFSGNEVHIEINATHDVKSTSLSFKGHPYTIEATYSLKPDRLTRTSLTVRERTAPTEETAEKDTAEKSAAHVISGLFSRAVRLASDPVERAAIHDAYSKAFKEDVVINPVSVPTHVHVENPKVNRQPVKMASAAFVPLETKTENGWFASSQFLCDKSMGAIGIRFQPRQVAGGHELELTSIITGSPAHLLGLRPGDRLTSYRSPSESKAISFAAEYQSFQSYVAKLASEKDAVARQIILTGIDSTGGAFTKTVSLCPTLP